MRIALGADHAGCGLKAALAGHLAGAGHEVLDLGTDDPAVSVDYPTYAVAVARAVVDGRADVGILACGTGIGMSIAANKIPGIRAALVHDVTTARLARQHNDANVLTLGGRLTAVPLAVELVDTFLATAWDPRHGRRIEEIAALDEGRR
jgi:ribose 5-phosphate isomerase B